MKARDVHAVIEKRLAPWCAANGLVRLGRTASTWYLEAQQFYLVRVSLGKLGYVKPLGGTMLFRAWTSPILLPQLRDEQPLLLKHLLPESHLRRMKQLSDQVTKKVLAGDWASALTASAPAPKTLMEQMLVNMKKSVNGPYVSGMWQDSMDYVDAEDVASWADFVVEAMPHVVAALLTAPSSSTPRASQKPAAPTLG